SGVVRQVRHLGGKERRADRQRYARGDGAGEKVDLVALDVARNQLTRLVGVAAHGGLQELGRLPAELAVELLDGKIETVARFGAQRGERPRYIIRNADFDGVGR